jgi:23S rRNA (adenine2030-N6)-methyltransferase
LYAEFCPEGPSGEFGLYGSGMLILNPPWKIDEGITELGPWLTDTLGSTTDTSFQVQWLRQAE